MRTTETIQKLYPAPGAIPEKEDLREPIHQRRYLVDGELREWSGRTQDVLSPIGSVEGGALRRRVIGSYPLMGAKEALEALDAAVRAYDAGRGEWPTMSVGERIRRVQKFVELMRPSRDEVVKRLMWEIGKTRGDSEKEFDRTIEYILATLEALKNLDRASSDFVFEQGVMGQIRRSPLGVVLCMGPFNYPLNETFTTLIPALVMGNSILMKQPSYGALLYGPMLEAFRDCFPKGVVNTLYGRGRDVAGPLMETGKIDSLAFIGSSRVANVLQKQHPKPHRCRFILGLDAKNAAIVLPCADLDSAVKECLLGSLSFNGQRCTALKILFVHRSILEPFLDGMRRGIEALGCGMPWDKGAQLTPIPEEGKTVDLTALVEDAKGFGAKVINEGGGATFGTFFYPALVSPVDKRMRLWHEEQFGPILPVVPYDDIEEPIQYLIDSPFGQQVSVFGKEAEQIARLIDPLVNQVCRLNINSQCQRGPDTFPFTGRKDSAVGTLSVTDALKVFSIRSLVAAKQTDLNKAIVEEIVRERKSNFLSTDYIL
jgi:glyceraldehyde-3-phosphate dehydrogenase (NADP+)